MKEKPNVLMIATDHWFQKLLGISGHPVIMTPTLDAIARDGIRFTNCYSECPVCIPARRTLMTGMSPRSHGDRVYSDRMEMPKVKTLAQSFRDAGYQAYAVGKLHVYPQRDRIGFDDVILMEEGRYEFGNTDDYQTWLGEQGYIGQEFMHGMGNNTYYTRPWHLSEEAHPANWVTREMIKMIQRKDPTRPAFYYASYQQPHPPLVPLQCYLDMYSDDEIDLPTQGEWDDEKNLAIEALQDTATVYTNKEMIRSKRAFYAACTHVDHQIRLLIGSLREAGLLDNTIILFTSDHGDMLFDHNMVAKRVFYDNSANVPLIISGKPVEKYRGMVDKSLIGQTDIMPTLLDLCGIEIPETVEGISAFSKQKRDMLYGEISEGDKATRMVHDGRYKLIYYPVGNYIQLFDIENDPDEKTNLANDSSCANIKQKLTDYLIANLYKGDEEWAKGNELVGTQNKTFVRMPDYTLNNQRGGHWPPPIR